MGKTLPVKAQHCRGCEQDFYNGNNPLGVSECWSLKAMRLKMRRRVAMNDVPPWTRQPEKLPNCYQQSGYIFVDPKVAR